MNSNNNSTTKVYNLIILDESGSMSAIRSQALSGANETIQTIKASQESEPELQQFVTFVTFDSGQRQAVRTLIDCVPAAKVRELGESDYSPWGGTPLFDAMGTSINHLRTKVQEGDKVLVTIITDGMENSSREYSGTAISALVAELKAMGWTFTYIGANQDSIEVALKMNITSAMNFKANEASSRVMFEKMNSYRKEYYRKISRKEEGIEEDFFQMKSGGRITPERISNLEPGQIFVFGSNLQGHHAGGAARFALDNFGAVWGQGVGLQGQSYAIPTMQGGVETIRPYVDEFIRFADLHQEMTFLVTRIGCGIAGFRDYEIAPLFAKAIGFRNIWLPESFWKILWQY